jgi:hypothetical protein
MRARVHVTIAAACGLAAGCSSGFNRGEMQSELNASNPMFSSSEVEEIEKLKPQVALPITIAVSQPVGEGAEPWSDAEIEVIESWLAPLAGAAVAKQLVVIPSSLITSDCMFDRLECVLRKQRAAAARLGADTLLVVTESSRIDPYLNPLSLLDLTVVGLWLAPGHHRDALTMLEGLLIDNRNEYLYAFARAEGEATQLRPFAFLDDAALERGARANALQALGVELVEQAGQLKTR